ncbi:hypothetical protein F3Y22_tig00002840pilonHSYRG00228 [Hibiscus syriacus]|uniref:Reverse transcriptase Ty1/copia-type domain-containing protein n=1 Tax=Hibiscus syriacus TaxID=106335 RepID=A0A6A3CVB8_HIBSY|nr:hypothetical protein F3Y22_tig00002840pilonHSYRG00228 [Hibiscus syriacus]
METISQSSNTSEDTSPRGYRSLYEIYEATEVLYVAEPNSFEEAFKKDEWKQAMEEELAAIKKNQTWELMDLPVNKEAIGVKWVFRTKFNADGSTQKHKA